MQRERKAADLFATQHNLATRRQLSALGFTDEMMRSRVKRGVWVSPARGLYGVAGVPRTFEHQVMAKVLTMKGAFASHRTALYLHGLIERPPNVIEISVRNGSAYRRRPGVRIHQARAVKRADVQSRCGIPTTTPVRTIVDSASVLHGEELEDVVDTAVVKGFVTIRSVRRHISARGLRLHNGVGRLCDLLDDREIGVPESKLERAFIRLLRRFGLPEPDRQVRRGDRRIDFFYSECGIAIELDGRATRVLASDFEADRERRNELWLSGAPPLHFTWRQVTKKPDYIAATLRTALG